MKDEATGRPKAGINDVDAEDAEKSEKGRKEIRQS